MVARDEDSRRAHLDRSIPGSQILLRRHWIKAPTALSFQIHLNPHSQQPQNTFPIKTSNRQPPNLKRKRSKTLEIRIIPRILRI
ncbi:hypothetical protein CDL15_Pgr004839 [Punica granatum]|uniref:Uncharacterized protein n=1 Tax=Punica granatum TaxID=22663 RepID=A0A218W660_PUNGR|nr:hypothetical protein CDL15_Pgr004839 [Punica granatum]